MNCSLFVQVSRTFSMYIYLRQVSVVLLRHWDQLNIFQYRVVKWSTPIGHENSFVITLIPRQLVAPYGYDIMRYTVSRGKYISIQKYVPLCGRERMREIGFTDLVVRHLLLLGAQGLGVLRFPALLRCLLARLLLLLFLVRQTLRKWIFFYFKNVFTFLRYTKFSLSRVESWCCGKF